MSSLNHDADSATTMTPEEAEALLMRFYEPESELCRMLLKHSRSVADKAEAIRAARCPHLDAGQVRAAALLHDIGIFLTDAPGIGCHGTEPYLLHGFLGAELMRREGLPRVARVCERHTGTGLTAERIQELNLPLPAGSYEPETLEEKLICYADKFFSKSHPERERSVADTARSLEKFGAEGVKKFLDWATFFEGESILEGE